MTVAIGHSPYRRHRELVDAIERDCRVADWRAGDVDLWPIVSQDLFLEFFRKGGADTAPGRAPFVARAASTLATPVLNRWKSRSDLAHFVAEPYAADALFLGDGVSLDHVDGAWRDRFGDPIIAALERQGRTCFVMQSGNLTRLPWARPTYSANRIAAHAAIVSAISHGPAPEQPDFDAVMRFATDAGVAVSSLSAERLTRRARAIALQAEGFERVLRRVCPSVAFVVTYYAGLGHAFSLACRRQGVLCVDLQHCPHDDRHRAYRWSQLPPRGYSTLPGLFWTWTEEDAANIRQCADGRWHRAIAGGHTQIAALEAGEGERHWQAALASMDGGKSYDREILVALQPIGRKRHVWAALAAEIEASPQSWRWWIRRHPASTPFQDRDYDPLLSLTRPDVVIREASQLPLPALLPHMDALVSLASGAAAEAAMLGVPAFFLDEEVLDTFPRLISSRRARLVGIGMLIPAIRRLPDRRISQVACGYPLENILGEIDKIAQDYTRLCRQTADEQVDSGGRVVAERQSPRAA